jgi:hypothetical protein
MHKADIKVTTPQKSIIYAIGASSESNERIWGDPESWASANYVPGYVLEIGKSGLILVLMARSHPDSARAKLDEQAKPLDALDYTVEDYHKRQAVLVEYSHWPLSVEQAEARNAALAELKELPKGWFIQTTRTSNVRMLWADYAERLQSRVTDAKAEQAKKEALRVARVTEKRAVLEKLVALDVGQPEEITDYQVNRYGDTLELSYKVVQKLIEGYHPVSKTEDVVEEAVR